MVLPQEIGDAAQAADAARVKAWLDSGGDVNDVDENECALLHTVEAQESRAPKKL